MIDKIYENYINKSFLNKNIQYIYYDYRDKNILCKINKSAKIKKE